MENWSGKESDYEMGVDLGSEKDRSVSQIVEVPKQEEKISETTCKCGGEMVHAQTGQNAGFHVDPTDGSKKTVILKVWWCRTCGVFKGIE